MEMIRSFNSVGQGAFYTECFENEFNVVYDCGTLSEQHYLEQEIKRVFKKGTIINAVFLSHLHFDHISGLEYLMKHFHVERILLPLLTEENKVLTLLKHKSTENTNDFIFNFIMRPQDAIDKRDKSTKIVYIDEYDGNDYEIANFYLDPDERRTLIRSGTRIVVGKKKWIYVPFNFRQKSRIEQLKKSLLDNGIGIPSDEKEVINLVKNKKEELIKVFKGIEGDLNTNSMTLYSGLDNGHAVSVYRTDELKTQSKYSSSHALALKPGCLYLGDYNLNGSMKWKDFIKSYDKYLKSVGIIQIPHHGSRYNYNTEILKFDFEDYIVSAALKNRYRHPHQSVMKDILSSGKNLKLVTENGRSLEYIINF